MLYHFASIILLEFHGADLYLVKKFVANLNFIFFLNFYIKLQKAWTLWKNYEFFRFLWTDDGEMRQKTTRTDFLPNLMRLICMKQSSYAVST